MEGLAHERVPAALDDIGAAREQVEELLLALAFEDDIALPPFLACIAIDIAGARGGRAEDVDELPVRGIALVDEHMPLVARGESKHPLPEDGRRDARGRGVARQQRRRVQGNDEVGVRGPEEPAGREPLEEGVPAHVGRQVMAAGRDDVLVIEREAGQSGAFRRARDKIFQIRHADMGAEVVDQAQGRADMAFPLEEQRHGAGYGGAQIHLVVPEDRAEIGQTLHAKFRLQHAGRVIVGHKEELVLRQATRQGQAAHGVAVACAVDAVEDACHEGSFLRAGPAEHGPARRSA